MIFSTLGPVCNYDHPLFQLTFVDKAKADELPFRPHPSLRSFRQLCANLCEQVNALQRFYSQQVSFPSARHRPSSVYISWRKSLFVVLCNWSNSTPTKKVNQQRWGELQASHPRGIQLECK